MLSKSEFERNEDTEGDQMVFSLLNLLMLLKRIYPLKFVLIVILKDMIQMRNFTNIVVLS